MKPYSPSDLKSILHSKRANLYYLEYCRVLVNGGRVEFVTDEGSRNAYWNIPIANTTCILLGTGTSITQNAARLLGAAGVLYGYCGGGGTPLISGNERMLDIEFHLPQSEYRPPQYVQQWMRFWYHDDLRLQAAIEFQKTRLQMIKKHWLSPQIKKEGKFLCSADAIHRIVDRFETQLQHCLTSNDVLSTEANMTKALYKLAAQTTQYGDFTRVKQGQGNDLANQFLDHGNYLAYGLAATATWVLGIPQSFAVLHGKTRRGALVFDVADLVKDALVLPQAFIAAMEGDEEQAFRQRCLRQFQRAEALDVMIETIQTTALTMSEQVS